MLHLINKFKFWPFLGEKKRTEHRFENLDSAEQLPLKERKSIKMTIQVLLMAVLIRIGELAR